MNCAYPEIYLSDAMRNMGELTEYVSEALPEMDLNFFFKMFVISGYAERFEKGDPQVVCGLSGTELCQRVLEACGATNKTWHSPLVRYDTGEDYWGGYILAYYQWKKNISFEAIFNRITYLDLLVMYPALHTASDEKAYMMIEQKMMDRTGAITRLQEYRKRIGMSQRELADASGVNIRTLQQYEIRDKDISHAAAEKVIALSNVLNCRPEELIEI